MGPPDRARFYGDLVLNCINDAARRALETMMKGYQYQSDFAKKYYGQGLEEGRKEALKEGLAQGERAVLLRQLRSRFGELPAAAVAKVEGAETGLLERWADRVLVGKTLAEVLDEPS